MSDWYKPPIISIFITYIILQITDFQYLHTKRYYKQIHIHYPVKMVLSQISSYYTKLQLSKKKKKSMVLAQKKQTHRLMEQNRAQK